MNVAARWQRLFAPYTPAQRRTLWVIAGVALVARVVWVIVAHRPPQTGDPVSYVFYGDRLSRGHGYDSFTELLLQKAHLRPPGPLPPTAFYSIGYPLVLAAVFEAMHVVGIARTPAHEAWAFGLFHAVIGTLTVLVIAAIARRVASARVAVTAAAIVAVWPNLVFYTATAHLETVYVFVVALAVLVLVRALEDRELRWRPLLGAGALLGVAAEIRPLVLLLAPGLLLAVRRRGETWKRSATVTITVVLVAIAFLVPWSVRNAIQMPGFVAVTTGSGDALCVSRDVHATGRFESGPWCQYPDAAGAPEYIRTHPQDVVEVNRNRATTSRSIKFVLHHPVDEIRLWGWRAYWAFRDDHEGFLALQPVGDTVFAHRFWDDVAGSVADAYYWLVIAAALAGAFALARRPRSGVVVVWGAVAAGVAVPFLLFGDPRYKVPALPFLAIVAAVGIEQLRLGAAAMRAQPAAEQAR